MNGFENWRNDSNLEYEIVKNSLQNGNNVTVGKVTARLDDCSFDAVNMIDKICFNAGGYLTAQNPSAWDRYGMADSFKGWSKCNISKGDNFDLPFGKSLAKDRCLSKYHKQLNKRFLLFLSDAREVVARMERYLDKHNIDYSSVDSVEVMKQKKFAQNNK